MTEETTLRLRARTRRIWRMHRPLWKLPTGRLGRVIGGMLWLELITTGHKSVRTRTLLI